MGQNKNNLILKNKIVILAIFLNDFVTVVSLHHIHISIKDLCNKVAITIV